MVDRILKLIKEKNMTARNLTELLGVNSSTVSEWKKGKTKPSVEHVRKMAEIFDVSTDYLINGTEPGERRLTPTDIEENMDFVMRDIFMRLNEEHKNAVRDFFYLCLCEMEKDKKQRSSAKSEQEANIAKDNSFEVHDAPKQPIAANGLPETGDNGDDDAYSAFNAFLFDS